MTYPQPSSVDPVLGGQDHFRLITEVVSPGDIYESEVSALAFALGPNSDVATVLITYFDPDATTMVGQAIISPDRDFVGRIDARNEAVYPGPPSSGRRGRILFSLADIYDQRWRPDVFTADDQIAFEAPILDVIQYFTSEPSVESQRSDKAFRYQYFAIPTNPPHSSWVVIPSWGRKSGFFTFKNLDAGEIVTATVYGVKLSTSASPGPAGAFQKSLATSAIAAAGGTFTYPWKSSADGAWDYFAISLLNYRGSAMPVTVTLSDDVE